MSAWTATLGFVHPANQDGYGYQCEQWYLFFFSHPVNQYDYKYQCAPWYFFFTSIQPGWLYQPEQWCLFVFYTHSTRMVINVSISCGLVNRAVIVSMVHFAAKTTWTVSVCCCSPTMMTLTLAKPTYRCCSLMSPSFCISAWFFLSFLFFLSFFGCSFLWLSLFLLFSSLSICLSYSVCACVWCRLCKQQRA